MPMAAERVLWTGPYGSGVRDHAVASASLDPSALWVVPSPLARDQVRAELAARCRATGTGTVQSAGRIPRVWCWADLWARVRAGSSEGPAVLSDGAAGAVFREAIRRARQAGETEAIEAVLDWPGYRRRLRGRFAAWTADERPPRDTAPADPVAAAEWAAFRRYRALLAELGAEDEPGLAVWASRRLGRRSSGDASAIAQATFLDFESPTRAMWRALDHATRRARSVRVTLGFEAADEDPAGTPYEANADVRDRLVRTLGFAESTLEPDLWRPAGLRDVERTMFRPRAADASRVSVHQGLAIRGAPVGDGVARVLAREVRDRLGAGVAPDDILVVFRQWGEQADVALEALRDWGIPAAAESRRPLGSDPAVAALLLAIGLPGDEWSTDRVIRLLRNGRIQPGGPGMDPLSMAAAASVVRTSPVFRGRETLLNWLDRAVANARDNTVKAERARLARTVVERVLGLIEPVDRPRPFGDQVDRLFGLARALGIVEVPAGQVADGPAPSISDCAGLDRLRDALEDRAAVVDRLGRGGGSWTWSDFAEEVESLAAELTVPPVDARPGSIRLATVDEVGGARAAHVILADLAEGTFPGREAVEAFLSLRPGAPADADARRAFSREMLRFLRVLGASGRSLTLLYPTTDAKGQDLLRAGFLDELMGRLEPSALAACHRAVRRLDPALVDAPELAGSPADLRVRAVALARARGDSQTLAGLLDRPGHRRPLAGTAAALRVLSRRLRGTPFGEYDGLLRDGHVMLDVAALFPPEYLFSASQLETYSDCPFLFYCKYVLKLEPAERRDEIDEDYTERGSRIHRILEELERRKLEAADIEDMEQIERDALENALRAEPVDPSEVAQGLAEIERRRLVQTVLRYRVQHLRYAVDGPAPPVPHQFEVSFGDEDSGHPWLELGRGSRAVRLQGKIDRIDIVNGPDGPAFRVIDYKSGHGPSATEVRNARKLQLPLYAMAVERLDLTEQGLALGDVGYWALREKGYTAIAFEAWDTVQAELESYVGSLVDRLRRGEFVVDSQLDGCEGFCEFRAICRVRQARLAAKRYDRPEAPQWETARRGGKSKGRRGGGAGGAP